MAKLTCRLLEQIPGARVPLSLTAFDFANQYLFDHCLRAAFYAYCCPWQMYGKDDISKMADLYADKDKAARAKADL